MTRHAKETSPGLFDAPGRAIDGAPIYTVSALTREIRSTLERHVGQVWVTGEISNFRRPASGHCYFTLKDEHSQITVVMWRTLADVLKFDLKDGMAVLAQGEVTVYEPRGQYQIVLRRVEPVGLGALQLAFQQLKERLLKEGLFDEDRKKSLPRFPDRIALITSSTGAAVQDMLNVIRRRFPPTRIVILPVRVQGDAAAREIAQAITIANEVRDIDVMIVGRGGGSLEDLWPFNEEIVARAIAASRVPVISAVGHETDFTIADFVADVRALTPTDAGMRVVPDTRELDAGLRALADRLGQGLLGRLAGARERLNAIKRSYAFRRPLDLIRAREQRLDDLCQQMARGVTHAIGMQRRRIEAVAGRLESLSPLAVLSRGYSITFKEPEKTIVRSVADLKPGDLVRTRLTKGEFVARVERQHDGTEKTVRKKPARRTGGKMPPK